MTLTEFILARIAEDEKVARGVAEPLYPSEDLSERFGSFESDHTDGDSAHIQRWEPARVLAECEAKRAIVKAASGWRHEVVEDCWYTCAAATGERDGGECCDDARRGQHCDCGRDYKVLQVLGLIASIYADHPDFDPAWSA
jgi:hypothetical protein